MTTIIDELKSYMFTKEVVLERENMNISNQLPIQKTQIIKSNIKQYNKNVLKEENEYLITEYKDKLFWYFFMLYKGMDEYNMVGNKNFTIEKEFKIKTIDLMREKKSELKVIKCKLNEIEDNLVNSQIINLKTLEALCFVYKKSMLYYKNRIYLDFNYGENSPSIIYKDSDHKRTERFILKPTEEKITDIRTNYYLINMSKPIKSISSYTVAELQEISIKLKLSITDNVSGKKLLKKTLYENILGKIII